MLFTNIIAPIPYRNIHLEVSALIMANSMAGADYDEGGSLKCQLICKSQPQKGLQVCYETRAIMLGKLLISEDVKLRLDPAVDTLYFGPNVAWGQVHRFSSFMKTEQLRSLRYLVIEEDKLAAFMLGCSNRSPDLSVLRSLNSLSITLLEDGPWARWHQGGSQNVGQNFHCDACKAMRYYLRGFSESVGRWCWRFPTLKELERTLRLSASAAENRYWKVLSDFDGRITLFAWLWDYTHGTA
jgi:hypothetical protein